MRPAWFRKRWGFAAGAAASLGFSASPAAAQTFQSSLLSGAAPMAIAVGAVAFGVIASFAAFGLRHRYAALNDQTEAQLAGARADLDELEALLSAMPEVTIVWNDQDTPPRVFGDPEIIEVNGRNLLSFPHWLAPDDAGVLAEALSHLRISGQPFSLNLSTREGRGVRALGRPIGSGVALRLRLTQHNVEPLETESPAETEPASAGADQQAARAILSLLQKPAWVRDAKGKLIYTNAAYRTLAHRLEVETSADGSPVELFTPGEIKRHLSALGGGERAVKIQEPLPDIPEYQLILFSLTDGTAGYLGLDEALIRPARPADPSHLLSVIDTLATPVAVFDAEARLQQFNSAYAQLFRLEPGWLKVGMSERQILDRLRSDEQLPVTPDYQAWRLEHLKSYQLTEPQEKTWHLPDGRSINLVSAPAAREGGVIYVFEDVTGRLKLESTNKALVNVQRETLNALSEAVAVFFTDGRLRLYNPRLSEIWKLPINQLGDGPHIDRIGEVCAHEWPEDGAAIWKKLKRAVVDLSPNRADTSGRLSRSDGRLIDYSAVRLPDGQTMLTFIDVTESANFERVLKERNNALLTADRLKDAFVQNVSYELRSPLTNIIGFADLLASGAVGPLNERQKQYTDYIQASSATLGLLIDNILDLTHVDAGIAELNLEEQSIPALIERARAGLHATLTGTGEQEPLNLVVRIEDDLPPFIADGKRVVQVLYNLLSNAAKFSDPGGEVILSVEAHAGWIRFIIEDEGVGVPEEIRAAMFNRFEGHAVEGRQRGAGLGLSIVKAFVEMHGGTVSADARLPRGTKVIVALPEDASKAIAPNAARTGTLSA